MGIKDRDVRDAISTLEDEFENLEAMVDERDKEIVELESRVEELEAGVEGLNEKIKELELALSEAYLTSEVADEFSREDATLSSGCGTDVPDSTGDKAVD